MAGPPPLAAVPADLPQASASIYEQAQPYLIARDDCVRLRELATTDEQRRALEAARLVADPQDEEEADMLEVELSMGALDGLWERANGRWRG